MVVAKVVAVGNHSSERRNHRMVVSTVDGIAPTHLIDFLLAAGWVDSMKPRGFPLAVAPVDLVAATFVPADSSPGCTRCRNRWQDPADGEHRRSRVLALANWRPQPARFPDTVGRAAGFGSDGR